MTPHPLRTTLLLAALAAAAIALIRKAMQKNNTDPYSPQCQPVTGPISSPFGSSRPGHKHTGVDIAVPSGTPVRAPWPGTVTGVYFDATYGGGKTVIINHPNGYRTGYCHLSQYRVAQGDTVQASQVIALSGNTGAASTGPHLHFSLTNPQGAKIDPQTLFNFQA